MRLLSAIFLASLTSCSVFGQTYTISTFAGGGLPVSVPGLSASLGSVDGVAVDPGGNVFIALNVNHIVLRLDAATGIVTLVAGTGTPGLSGDNGPATAARLSFPSGVAVDGLGNIYIIDAGNNRIRKVSNGIITTIAGNGVYGFSGDNGPATSAQLGLSGGIAGDSIGNLYISDIHRIRKVSNGMITTIAGTGTPGFSGDNGPATSAQLNYPEGLAVDSTGNLYIVDLVNYRIRKVSNGIITTVAGSGGFGSSGDNGPATAAKLGQPEGIAADSAGNLYITDYEMKSIRKVSNGIITTVAGNGTFGFSGDNGPATSAQLSYAIGVAVSAAGTLYIADKGNQRIRKVSNGIISTVAGGGLSLGDNGPATSAQLLVPTGLAVDPTGSLYISDDRVRKVSNGIITTVAGTGTPGFSGDNGPATSAQLQIPYGLAVDSSGNLYIADTDNGRIRKVSNGVITTVAGGGASLGDSGPATSAQLNNVGAVAIDPAGSLYISDSGTNRIRKVSNGIITTVAGNGAQGGLNGDNGPATSARLDYPQGIAVDLTGNLYIIDAGSISIRKVSNGLITTIAGGGLAILGDNGPATNAFFNPTGIAVDSVGNVYISDTVSLRIRVLKPAISPCTYAVTPTSLQAPASGGNFTAAIQTTASCAWTISGLPNWIAVSGATSGTGPANITLIVSANAGAARNTNISIAGISVPASQQGAPQQGTLSVTAVNNAASNLSGPIAPGEIVVLTGFGLGPSQITSAHVGTDGLYDPQTSGTSVQFSGIGAPMIYTSATQVAAIVPYEITGASAQVTVTYQGQTSAPVTVAVVASAPGLFTLDSTGQGQAAAVNQNHSINGASVPAPIGSVISLYATGEGQTSPPGVDGKPASVSLPTPNLPVNVTIGGVTVNGLQYVGAAPGEVAGLLQINVQIPSGITPGSAVPVVIRVGGATSQAGVTIAVSAN